MLAMQSQPRRSPTPAAVPGPHACRPPDQASRPSSHQLLSQEHLRSQRAAQAAWVAEQAQKTGKETTGPSLSSSPSTHPDIIRVAKSRPMTEAAWLAWIEEETRRRTSKETTETPVFQFLQDHHPLREGKEARRAARTAWLAEQAQRTSKETTEPSQTSSTSIDPDIVARNPPITDPDNLRNLTPAQFNQDQKAFLRTMQDQSRPSPTPAAVPGPTCYQTRLAGHPDHQHPVEKEIAEHRTAGLELSGFFPLSSGNIFGDLYGHQLCGHLTFPKQQNVATS